MFDSIVWITRNMYQEKESAVKLKIFQINAQLNKHFVAMQLCVLNLININYIAKIRT